METITEQTIKYKAKDGKIFTNKIDCERHDSNLTNLYDETIKALGDKKDKVLYVNYEGDFFTTIDDFLEKAKDIWYYAGYGLDVIDDEIYIVGENWWLERAEYDGSEWWEYKELPIRNKHQKEISKNNII